MVRPAAIPSVLALACLLLGCGGGPEGSTLERLKARGEIRIGTEPEFPPFESKDAEGRLVGLDVDLGRALARDLGVRARFEEMAFDSLPTALATGKIDVILSGMTATPERAKSRAFSKPYYRTRLCLLVGTSTPIEKASDVDGKRVVVKLGTTGDLAAQRLFPHASIVRLDTEGACALEVVNGRADAFLYDQHSIERHHRENPDTTRALLEPLSDEPYAIACRRGDDAFRDRLDRFLDDVRADGRYQTIFRRWFGTDPPESW